MLVLIRRVGETIKIGDDIDLSVLEVKGHQVRFGIIAPETISVHRAEIYEKIQAQKLELSNKMASETE